MGHPNQEVIYKPAKPYMPEKDRFSEFLSFLSEVWKFPRLSKAEPEKLKLRAGENRQPDLERENAGMGREKAEVV